MFHDRCDHALRTAREDFERTLAVLREENSTMRRMLEASAARVDTLTTELARSLVIQPTPSPVTVPLAVARPRTASDPIVGLGNVFESVKLGDPLGEFTSMRAASLMAVEEDEPHGAAAAA